MRLAVHHAARPIQDFLPLPLEKLHTQIIEVLLEIKRHFAEDSMERSDAKLLMGWHRDVVFPASNGRSQPNMTPGLASDLVAQTAKERCQFRAVQIAWKPQAGMTSSLTR